MAVYRWSGKTPRGIIESGEITASTKEDVVAILGKKNIVPTLITEKPKKALFALGGKIKDKDIMVFTRQFSTMINAGLPLVQALEILSNQVEKAMKLKKKVKRAMVYTAVISTVAVLVIVIIMVFVVPTFSRIFAQLGGTLPLPTRMVMGLSKFIAGTGGIVSLVSIIAAVVFIIQFKRTEKGKKMIDFILLKLPIFGTLLNKVAVAKFTRTLGTLVSR